MFDVVERPGCMIGHVGYLRGINLLETNNNYFDELAYYRNAIDYGYMVNNFVPLVDNLFRESGFVDAESNLIDLKGETIAIVDKDIYEVGQDGSVMQIDSYVAIGSGAELALGSLDTTDNLDAKDRLIWAIKAAMKNIYCGGKAIIMNNVDEEIYQFEF